MSEPAAGYGGGSSPRTRGTLRPWSSAERGLRFIPAHAGNICRVCSVSLTWPVHPRARGEHVCPVCHDRGSVGSSPRTRGTYGERMGCRLACAVHPRARGEHLTRLRHPRRHAGSSPRTRGTWAQRRGLGHQHGSSPRTRGTCDFSACPWRIRRFIPAHAGNMNPCICPPAPVPVHPRARGEHSRSARLSASVVGSSPRTRGTLSA